MFSSFAGYSITYCFPHHYISKHLQKLCSELKCIVILRCTALPASLVEGKISKYPNALHNNF